MTLFAFIEILPQCSLLLFLVCAAVSFYILITLDSGAARAAYIWMSVPGAAIAAIHIGFLINRGYSDPTSLANSLFVWFLLIYASLNPGWIIFPVVLIRNVFAKSSEPVNNFTWLICCLFSALWVWGFWIDTFVIPKIMEFE